MSVRQGYADSWPPAFSWSTPALYDERGVWCMASLDWLEARFGPPPKRQTPPARPAHAGAEGPPWAADALGGLPAVLTTDEAIGVLRTSRRNLYRWIAAGKLRAVRHGVGGSARVLIPRAAIAAYLTELAA